MRTQPNIEDFNARTAAARLEKIFTFQYNFKKKSDLF
jgi:hypothetical protein